MLTSTMDITRIKERIIAAKISEEIKCEAIQKRQEITGSYPWLDHQSKQAPSNQDLLWFQNATDCGQFLGTSDFWTLLTTQTKHFEEK